MAKVLVVDDSETIRTQLRRDLEGAGHVVVEACDGKVGLQMAEENPDFQLLICDVNMPVMDGLEMCERLFLNEKFGKVPKFMLTTEAVPAMKQRAKAVGVLAWIIKPYVLDKLLAAISKVVG